MKNNFNAEKWLSAENTTGKPGGTENGAPKPSEAATGGSTLNQESRNREAVERALEAIEAACLDLTQTYQKWLALAFAFTEAFQESGRAYFHRVSQFHPEYDPEACDKQYDHCLKSNGSGISLATFFHYLKEADLEMYQHVMLPLLVPPSLPGSEEYFWDTHEAPKAFSETFGSETRDTQESQKAEEEEPEVPTFPEQLFPMLPKFLQEAVSPAMSKEERDMLLLGSLCVISACLPKVFGIYNGMKVNTNLFLFVTAPASAGKGRLSLCKRLVMPIHKSRRTAYKAAKQQYELELASCIQNKSPEKPACPPESMLFIPANNSSTGVFQLLSDNEGQGLIFETEGDTMSQIFRTEYGNYSDGFRKSFHHETISYYRRTDKEFVDIDYPCLSTVLSGTPLQVATLIPNAENGLFSRFLFYYMNLEPTWANVWEQGKSGNILRHYDALGAEFMCFFQELEAREEMEVSLSEQQQQRFNDYFSQVQIHYLAVHSDDYVATVRRMALICYRISMILSTLRVMEEGSIRESLECSDADFEIALNLVDCLIEHSSFVYNCLPQTKQLTQSKSRNQRFLDKLPQEFTRQDYLRAAREIKMSPKTAEKCIQRFLKAGVVERWKHGHYHVKSYESGRKPVDGFRKWNSDPPAAS